MNTADKCEAVIRRIVHGGPGLSWAGPGPDDEADSNSGQGQVVS